MAAKYKMAAKIYVVIKIFLHFFTFDISAQEYNVILHFQIIWVHRLRRNCFFVTFQGHIENKTTMAVNARHGNHPFLLATIISILLKIGLEFNLDVDCY